MSKESINGKGNDSYTKARCRCYESFADTAGNSGSAHTSVKYTESRNHACYRPQQTEKRCYRNNGAEVVKIPLKRCRFQSHLFRKSGFHGFFCRVVLKACRNNSGNSGPRVFANFFGHLPVTAFSRPFNMREERLRLFPISLVINTAFNSNGYCNDRQYKKRNHYGSAAFQ